MINLIVIFRKAKQSQQCQMFLVNTWQHPAARVGAFSFFSFFLPMSHISGLSHTNIQNIQNASNFKSIFAASSVFSAVLDALLCISQVQRWGTTCTSGGFPRLQGWEQSWQEDKRVESVPFGIQHNSTTLSHGFESLTKSSQAWFLRRHCQTSGAVSKRQVSKNLAGLNGAILSENMQKYARLAVKAATGRSNKAFKSTQRSLGVDNISVWVPSACTACSAGTKRGQRWKRPSLPNLRLRRWCLSACCQLGMEPETFREMSAAMLTQYYCDSYIYIYIIYDLLYILYYILYIIYYILYIIYYIYYMIY